MKTEYIKTWQDRVYEDPTLIEEDAKADEIRELRAALQAAIDAPEPEPVAWIGDSPTKGNGRRLFWTRSEAYRYASNITPLYAAAGAAPVLEDWRSAVAMAYGHLWHINNEPMAPIPLRSEESAYYAARKLLRDLLTTEERGEAINSVRAMLTASPKDPINGMVSSATSNALTGKLFSAVISRRK